MRDAGVDDYLNALRPRPHAAGSSEERMRRSFCALLFHHRDTPTYVFVRHVQTELVLQDRSEFLFVSEKAPLNFARRMTHRHTRIEHGEPRPVGAGSRRDDIALIRRVGVRAGVPVRNLVFSVVSWVWDHTVDVLPCVTQPRLQRQLAADVDERMVSCGVSCSTPGLRSKAAVGAKFPKPTSARYGPSGKLICNSMWIAGRSASIAIPRTTLPCRLVML